MELVTVGHRGPIHWFQRSGWSNWTSYRGTECEMEPSPRDSETKTAAGTNRPSDWTDITFKLKANALKWKSGHWYSWVTEVTWPVHSGRRWVPDFSPTVSAPLSDIRRLQMGNGKEKLCWTSGGASAAGRETWLFEKLPVNVGHVASSLWLKMCRNVCYFFRLRSDYATLKTHANCSDIAPWISDGVIITGRTPASVTAASKCKQTMYSLFNVVWW